MTGKLFWYGRLLAALIAMVATSLVTGVAQAPPVAAQATITVNTTTQVGTIGDSECTIEEAINLANGVMPVPECGASGSTIVFDSAAMGSSTITLSSALPAITAPDVVIDGGDAITLDGANTVRVLEVDTNLMTNAVTIRGLTIQNGNAVSTNGGGVRVSGGSAVIEDAVIAFNSASSGAGIYVESGAKATIRDSRIFSNVATSTGGGISIGNASARIERSLITVNSAQLGAAVFNNSSLTTPSVIVNSTITTNAAAVSGGGIYNADGVLQLVHTTATNNSAPTGAGIWTASDSVTDTQIAASIVSGNSGGDGVDIFSDDLSEDIYESGCYNVIGTASNVVSFLNFASAGCDHLAFIDGIPNLDGLTSDGVHVLKLDGPTYTGAGPGIDFVNSDSSIGVNTFGETITTDQTGYTRDTSVDLADSGAYENRLPTLAGPIPQFTTFADNPLSVPAAQGLVQYWTDVEGDPLGATGPNAGGFATATDGSFVYTPAAGFTGLDNRTDAVVSDRACCGIPALITVQVLPGCMVGTATVSNPNITQSECDALEALYTATDGANWADNGGTNASAWTDITGGGSTNPCDWHGITCDSAAGSLTELDLNSNGLTGPLPAEIGDLTNLEDLWLNNNALTGSIPTQIGNLTNLESVGLFANSLSGSLPTEIGNLTNLEYFSISGNTIGGTIPTTIGNLTNLQILYLGSNQLTGAIPTEVGNLTNLEQLHVDDNQLTGSIPAEIGNLTKLESLWLNNNQLAGPIPPSISSLTSLTYVPLVNNLCLTADAATVAFLTPIAPNDVLAAVNSASCATAAMCNGMVATINMNLAGVTGIGTSGDDVILGTPGPDVIDGMGGDDTICGDDGDDNISGSDGKDFLFGGDGDDTMSGGLGNDRIRGQKGIDTINGGDGNDFLYGGVEGDTINGGDGNDTIGGFGGADIIDAGPGNDLVFGGFGGDTIHGGPGNDRLNGLIGNDTLNGDAGNDTINGGNGLDTLSGGDGDDTISGGNSADTLNGNDGDDTLKGGKSEDTLSGGAGTDTCTGNTGTDTADATCENIFGVP